MLSYVITQNAKNSFCNEKLSYHFHRYRNNTIWPSDVFFPILITKQRTYFHVQQMATLSRGQDSNSCQLSWTVTRDLLKDAQPTELPRCGWLVVLPGRLALMISKADSNERRRCLIRKAILRAPARASLSASSAEVAFKFSLSFLGRVPLLSDVDWMRTTPPRCSTRWTASRKSTKVKDKRRWWGGNGQGSQEVVWSFWMKAHHLS